VNDPYTMHTLDNGLRIVIEQMPDVQSAAAGFLVRTGSRDETAELAGVSHFLEHMMFKGTPKRTWRDITVDFDSLGSTYNAYTSEDRTVYFGWVRRKDIVKQMELLADMLRSALPADEFEMEKKVILEEIAMSRDRIEHVAIDFLRSKVFAGHPLEWPVLGYDDTVGNMARDAMWSYFQRQYAANNLTLVVAGRVDPHEIIGHAEALCGAWEASDPPNGRTRPEIRGGVDVFQTGRFKQQVLCLTFPSVGAADELAETASALTTILGGDNSRFFWKIVQAGLSPEAGAHHFAFTDCGLMLLYGTCQPENAEKLVEAIRREAKLISAERVEDREIDHVRIRRRTALAIESESPYHRLGQIMDDVVFRGAPRTVEQMLAEVDAVTVETIASYFDGFPINGEGHLSSTGPRQWPQQP